MAIAESDAYVKWAAWMLRSSPAAWDTDLCLVDSVVAPSPRQLDAALSGTAHHAATLHRHGLVGLRQRVVDQRPDAVLLAMTGPMVAAVTGVLATITGGARPVLVSGLPGVGLPVRHRAVRARRGIDVFVAHSRREREEYAAGFRWIGAEVQVALATLPFLVEAAAAAAAAARGTSVQGDATERRPVFAAQPSVPTTRSERLELLRRLATLGPPPPVVKLRQVGVERATHHEADPYGELLAELVASGDLAADALELSSRPLGDVLASASCLLTISSTAALEAIAAGVPVLIASDFGIGATQLNEVFAGSGLIGPITPAALAAAGAPRPEWAVEHYFHPTDENDWVEVVAGVVTARGQGATKRTGSFDQLQLRAAGRAVARSTVASARRAVGR
ncbi:MAG: hypothetical protein H0X22_12440 [Acidimicrobiia bacterium]|nr:hypothetical protein [Acidimicrobiia bacterium]